MRSLCVTVLLGLAGAAPAADAPAFRLGAMQSVAGLLEQVPNATVRDDAGHAAGSHVCGGRRQPGIFLHPPSPPKTTATITFPLDLAPVAEGERLMLLFDIGLRDGWLEATDPAVIDGVRFQVFVDDATIYDEPWRETGWGSRALDLTPYAGKSIALALAVHLGENSNADWAVWGDPRIVRLSAVDRAEGPALAVLAEGAQAPDTAWRALEDGLEIAADGRLMVQAATGLREAFTFLASARPARDTELAAEVVRYNRERNAYDVLAESTRRCAGGETALLRVDALLGEGPVLCRIRFADAAGLQLGPCWLATHEKRVELVSAGPDCGLIEPGREFALVVRLANRTAGPEPPVVPAAVRLDLPEMLQLAGDRARKSVPVPATLEGATVSWRVRAPSTPGLLRVQVALEGTDRSWSAPVRVVAPQPSLPPGPPRAGRAAAEGPLATIENGKARLTFMGDGTRFQYALLDGWDGAAWRRLGVFPHLGWLLLSDADGVTREVFIELQQASSIPFGLVLQGSLKDEAGVDWTAAVTVVVQSEGFSLVYSLETGQPVDLLAYRGPTLLVGETSFGAEKDSAVFPGLEYLEGGEVSSSTLDLAPPESNRMVPHPLRVTTPVMAVKAGGFVTALGWPPDKSWDGAHDRPSALFSSPNRLENQRNHLLALWVPGVPDHVPEGEIRARTPYRFLPRTTINLRAVLWVQPEPAVEFEAVEWWANQYGWPPTGTQPDLLESYLPLARDAYLNAIWSEEPLGWSHCVGWAPVLSPGNCTLILHDLWLNPDAPECEALLERVERVIAAVVQSGTAGLSSGAGCHVVAGELPFYRGYVAANVEGMEEHARALAAQMTPDGVWLWPGYPEDPRRDALAEPGQTAAGLCVRNAFYILRAAHLGGDAELATAGRKAVEALRRFHVPRGAQTWECPLHVPDIMASGMATRAFVEAFELFNDPAYLEDARYWAGTGLPFVYLWRDPGIPQMPYATIPVFGATYFTHSWLGVPVQWCGLDYAYAVRQLARHDPDRVWTRLARGITESGVRQVYPDGPSKGTLPDSWHLLRNRPQPADIGPPAVLINVLAELGHDPCVKFGRVGPYVLASGAEIQDATHTDGGLSFALRLFADATSYTLIRPVSAPPAAVRVNDGPYNQVSRPEELATSPTGWRHVPEREWLILKLTHEEGPATVRLSW